MTCPSEGSVVDGKKSFCIPWDRWTNCRECGYCVYEKLTKNEQLALFDERNEE